MSSTSGLERPITAISRLVVIRPSSGLAMSKNGGAKMAFILKIKKTTTAKTTRKIKARAMNFGQDKKYFRPRRLKPVSSRNSNSLATRHRSLKSRFK